MPRPQKGRRVCCMPSNLQFGPLAANYESKEIIIMTVDEYETIRLIDHEGFTQEESAKLMSVARTTVQWIYMSARKKLSDALVNGKLLKIQGGNYELCDGKEQNCVCGGCKKHKIINQIEPL